MPTGIQESFTGLICTICDRGIEHHSEISQQLCADCDEDYIRYCESCGDGHYSMDLMNHTQIRRLNSLGIYAMYFSYAEDSGNSLCHDCVIVCDDCGLGYEWMENADECCLEESSRSVNCYSYRPHFIHYRCNDNSVFGSGLVEPGVLYMGVEIEMVRMAEVANEFMDRLSSTGREFVYLKEDASIGYNGAELVTMPATIDAFEKMFPFDGLDWARSAGVRSFAYDSCGFHIHVARSAFSATHMWRFIRFQLKNPVLCQMVAQRSHSNYASWQYDESENSAIPDYVKGKRHNGRRYLAINFQNYNTVELRYFKGNILRGAIMKNLEFVQSMYDYTEHMTVRDVVAGGLAESSYRLWLDENQEKYPNLHYFLSNNESKEAE